MIAPMAFDSSLDLLAAAALFAAAVGAWVMAARLRASARLYLRFAAVLLAGLAVSVPLGMADVIGLLLLPLASVSLMIGALARFARPLPVFAASLVLVAALGCGFAGLLSGYAMLALAPAIFASLAVIAAALNGVAMVPVLAGVALLAAGPAFLEQGVRAGVLLFCAAALVGLAKSQLLQSSSSALRGQAVL
jgi:hypothetical protein